MEEGQAGDVAHDRAGTRDVGDRRGHQHGDVGAGQLAEEGRQLARLRLGGDGDRVRPAGGDRPRHVDQGPTTGTDADPMSRSGRSVATHTPTTRKPDHSDRTRCWPTSTTERGADQQQAVDVAAVPSLPVQPLRSANRVSSVRTSATGISTPT